MTRSVLFSRGNTLNSSLTWLTYVVKQAIILSFSSVRSREKNSSKSRSNLVSMFVSLWMRNLLPPAVGLRVTGGGRLAEAVKN